MAGYIEAALHKKQFMIPLKNGTYMVTVSGLRGVIATGKTVCRGLPQRP
ncbi:MAG: hypothetical protein MUO26_01960 [Methanotrichaceae archaeon]|nr:hypothetical protein [Methanotrichaceae archaeon]